MSRIKLEEYTALGDFIGESFRDDQPEIMLRFPKRDAAFLDAFEQKLAEVKGLESGMLRAEKQMNATAALRTEAALLNSELNFLVGYLKGAGLNTSAVSALKLSLVTGNIEGAIFQLAGIVQYVTLHADALTYEGMPADYAQQLQSRRDSLEANNVSQNSMMDARKYLTAENRARYAELYAMIAKISDSGKRVFAGSVRRDAYVIVKVLGRMRG